MKLWFETHSTSVDNERGTASGHLDPPLSERGRVQAAQLGGRYRGRPLLAVYSSDLTRAFTTADLAFPGDSIPRVRDSRLRECDYGSWAGCSAGKLEAAKLNFIDQPFPGGESFQDVVRRVAAFLAELPRQHGEVLLIGHRATWYALEHLLRGADLRTVIASAWKWQPGWEYELS